MKKLNKILIISIISRLSTSLAYANIAEPDCTIFGPLSYDKISEKVNSARENNNNESIKFLTINEQQAIITKNDLITAILNLQKQCCLNEKFSSIEACKNNSMFFNENALESEFLFNHIFDVTMRRLAGLDGDDDIYKKTKMTIDDKGAERRERINNQAESLKGSTPQAIFTEYNKYRSQSSPDKGYDIANLIYSEFTQDSKIFLNFVSGKSEGEYAKDSKKVANALKNYDQRTLYDRYKNSCALSEYFYILLGGDNSSDKNKMYEDIKSLCDKAIDKQISGENAYVKLVTQRSANLFLSNYIQGYMSYMYERQMNLQKLWKESNDRFLDVVRAVPCLQSECVH